MPTAVVNTNEILKEFREAEAIPFGLQELRQRYQIEMYNSMAGRFETDIPLSDSYWSYRQKWQVLMRMVDGSFFGNQH